MEEIEKKKSEMRGEVPEGWKLLKLKDIAKVTSGTTPLRSNSEYHKNGSIHWVKTTDLNNSKIFETEEKITEKAFRETSLRKYPIGTVLVAMYGGFNQIGRTGILQIEATTNQALSALTVDIEKVDPVFLINWLNGKVGDWKRLAGSSRKDPNITSKDVGDFPFLLIPLPEQQAIADCLSTWDGAIQVSEQLIRQKELQKKWLMQQLLTGKKRLKGFSGEWKNTKMKKIGFVPSKSPLIKIENQRLLTVKLHTKGVEFNNSDRPIISSSGRPYYERFEGEILIGRQNIHNGGIGLVLSEHSGNICSNAISSFKVNPDVSLEFVLHYLVHPDHYKLIEIFMGGTGQKELSEKQFLNLEMKFPSSIKEQQAIAAILSESDRELDLLRERLAKLREQKKGLMQGLLTGKRRLKINF